MAKAAILEKMKSICDECMEAYDEGRHFIQNAQGSERAADERQRLSLRDHGVDRTHRTVSKPSGAERDYLKVLHERMADGSIRSIVNNEPAGELHHPLGGFWETGKGLKAHDWFVIPLTLREHRLYHSLGRQTWERTFGSHEMLLKAFWKFIGFEPGEFMTVGMEPKR